MNLRATHYGYTYQDLLTGVALVDLMLGSATDVIVDTKGFDGDRFDDLTISYRSGRRVRVQIKHTNQDRELSKASFSGDRRSLKLDLLLDALLADLASYPDTTYRVIVRDGDPDTDLAIVLKPVAPLIDPGQPLPGVGTRRFRFDPESLRSNYPWKHLVQHLSGEQLETACAALIIDTNAPASTINFTAPGPAELALLRRVTEELGAGRPPNTHRAPEDLALALTHAATAARTLDGQVRREDISPRIGLTTDFGAVAEGHPVEPAVAVPRVGAAAEVQAHILRIIPEGGRAILTGEPGSGKSWLCEQLANEYRDAGWSVARHHCWLGKADIDSEERVRTDVVLGSLLAQLEELVPEAFKELRPRFAATSETLEAALHACRITNPEQNVLLIVDGLDHVDRILGRNTGRFLDPSRVLVDQLASVTLPPGVAMLIASQPGTHLDNASPWSGELLQMPRMSREEVDLLARRHRLIAPSDAAEGSIESAGDNRAIVDALYGRSSGNALYATYLCRHASRMSPLDQGDAPTPTPTPAQALHSLEQVPTTATDLAGYYDHLLEGMTGDQVTAIGALALCDFALTAAELGEMVPEVALFLDSALAALAPVLNSQPGLGGLKVHHESFSRHILRDKPERWLLAIRQKAAAWLDSRGFFADARAFRHLPDLLAYLDRFDELSALIGPRFVGDAVRALQPPEALKRVVATIARQSELRFHWPTLARCIEVRKAIAVYETESLPDTLTRYGDVVVSLLGAETVAGRLLYEGRPTFPASWGLQLCWIVDRAGASAPWAAYLLAMKREDERDRTNHVANDDDSTHLATQLANLRVGTQRNLADDDLLEQVAKHLDAYEAADLGELVEVFVAGLPIGVMPAVVTKMKEPAKAARAYMTLAELSSTGVRGLPASSDLAREAHRLNPKGDVIGYLRYGITPKDVLSGLAISDFASDLRDATTAITTKDHPNSAFVAHWLELLTLAHALDPTMPLSLAGQAAGAGFYREWLQFAITTVGLADDVAKGVTTAQDASVAVHFALERLASHAEPFTGSPRACDLYSINYLIHDVIENALVVVQHDDLERVLEHLIAIGEGTSTSLMGMAENGPLTTNDLLEVLSRVSAHIGVGPTYALIEGIRDRRGGVQGMYSVEADFELASARICLTAGATDEARECWDRAGTLLASYGGHKDPTIGEFIDTLPDLADVDIQTARGALDRLLDPAYLVKQHTDGRGTNHVPFDWWEAVARIDPIAAALDGSTLWLAELGFEDARVQTALEELLETQSSVADPIVMAALRMAAGSDWRRPDIDVAVLTRLQPEVGRSTEADAILTSIANNIAASYDDQPLVHAGDTTKSVATSELIDSVVALGGSAFTVREARREKEGTSARDRRAEPSDLLKALNSRQRPALAVGRDGAISAVRDYNNKTYDDDINEPRWSFDALVNAIGWRVFEAAQSGGAVAGIQLIDDVAHEIPSYRDNTMLAAIGEGLAQRCDDESIELKTVASYCLTFAYTRIRGGGGWRAFAGRERADLWVRAYALDPDTAETTLAAAVSRVAQSDSETPYGVNQAIVSALAAQPAATAGGTAIACWDAAFDIFKERVPGDASRDHHVYKPTMGPGELGDLNNALATLAVASISQGMRADLRRALLAVTLLLTCRPTLGQTALVRVLGQPLDAARMTWLLEVIKDCVPVGRLTDEMSTLLTTLARIDLLSVRVLAAGILAAHHKAVPDPPATKPATALRLAYSPFREEFE
ncbi:ATP-binding protein [Cryobacterium sp. TMT2-18-3]|uniref:NACHT domain-containing protein n=1 Tax=unclassified Cryobacterium TaxID=2649013 RepID=UPI001069DE4B|nr:MULTISPECIES: NACHT domain-containing protein [unclassified Cryobacterium]TFC28310.1 ATP-binding protein [Cryobacterium sp. TMT2-18-2]TFC62381.1 ATP-binding protein [Cryobacterium sp. TMT2-18-3]